MKKHVQFLADQTQNLFNNMPIVIGKEHKSVEHLLLAALDCFETIHKKLEELEFRCSCCNTVTSDTGMQMSWQRDDHRTVRICHDCVEKMELCQFEYVEDLIDRMNEL